jgi:hypothetical protein
VRAIPALCLLGVLAACQLDVAPATRKPEASPKPAVATVPPFTPPPGEAVPWKLVAEKANIPFGLRIRAAADLPAALEGEARETDFKQYELVTLQDPVNACLGWPDNVDASYERVVWFVDTGKRVEYGLQAKQVPKKYDLLCKPAIGTLVFRLPRQEKPITTTGGTPLQDPSSPEPSPSPTPMPSPTLPPGVSAAPTPGS